MAERIVWEYQPGGWNRMRYISLKDRKGRETGRSKSKPTRGKEKCEHREYIRNRAGRILDDPDTGYAASVGCKQVARWKQNRIKELRIRELGISGFNMVSKYCDRHAGEHGLTETERARAMKRASSGASRRAQASRQG